MAQPRRSDLGSERQVTARVPACQRRWHPAACLHACSKHHCSRCEIPVSFFTCSKRSCSMTKPSDSMIRCACDQTCLRRIACDRPASSALHAAAERLHAADLFRWHHLCMRAVQAAQAAHAVHMIRRLRLRRFWTCLRLWSDCMTCRRTACARAPPKPRAWARRSCFRCHAAPTSHHSRSATLPAWQCRTDADS